jgi:formamidopyrimidine-DNA glycosylase
MPELPEVETVVRDLRAARLSGARIARADVQWPRSVAAPSPPDFCSLIADLEILALSRRGKFIAIALSGGQTLLVHLRMTGRLLLIYPGDSPSPAPHDRVVFHLRDGRRLCFRDPRKFGRLWLARNPAILLGKLGPEPLEIALAAFADRLAARSRRLKPLLLDQTFLAGLGNIYVDEALWAARLHPLRLSDSLSPAEARALLRAIRSALQRGIRNLGTSLGHGQTNFQLPQGQRGRNREHLRAYGQTGRPCPRCQTPIRRILVAQRSTHLCPACQSP